MPTKIVGIGVACALMTTVACGGQAPTDTASEPVGKTEQGLQVGGPFTPFGYAGGSGGYGPTYIGCSGDQTLAGLFGHSGATTDQIAAVCANLNGDGTIRSYNWVQRWVGGNGGNYFQALCPSNAFVTGMWLHTSDTVNGIWLWCQTAAQAQTGWTAGQWVIAVNNNTGYEPYDSCNSAGRFLNPPGPAAVQGFYVKYATYIDALEPVCAPLVP